LDNSEKYKTAWALSVSLTARTAPRPRRPPSDSGRRCLALSHGFTATISRPLFSPPRCPFPTASATYKGHPPPPVEYLLPPPPFCRHCAAVLAVTEPPREATFDPPPVSQPNPRGPRNTQHPLRPVHRLPLPPLLPTAVEPPPPPPTVCYYGHAPPVGFLLPCRSN
jgi:hypothetical protein